MSVNARFVALPWAAWQSDEFQKLQLAATWDTCVLAPSRLLGLGRSEIDVALERPIASLPLVELARDGRTACIVVDDLARPTRAAEILPTVVGQLAKAGIERDAVAIVIATGTHGRPDRQAIEWKVGPEVMRSIRVEVHDAESAVVSTNIQYGQQNLKLNRTFLAADVKVAVGSVLPHPFAGYSGGAKLMLPGLADVAATARSHKFVQMGLRGGQDPDRNRFRKEIEDLARRIGLHYVVCVVPNAKRETAGVFAGDVVAAHRAACKMAKEVYATPVRDTYDCLILNAYPKDIDLIQAESVWTPLKTAKAPLVREDGLYVIATAASNGLGCHGLFGPGGASYREPRENPRLRNRELWVYSPGVGEQEARKLYWHGYALFRDASTLADALTRRLPKRAKVGVLPCAPMQQIDDRRPDIECGATV